jgi:hypothetical protein
LEPYQEVRLRVVANDKDQYDAYDPDMDEWHYDEEVPDSVNWGETEAKHHIEWSVGSGHGSLPYGRFGLYEDPYGVPQCFQHHHLIYRAGGPLDAGHVILRLTIDDNDFDGDQEEDPQGRWIRSDDPALGMDINLWVIEVASLTWQKYSDNYDLDDCPNNGGKRIFPEKKSYNDTAGYRNKVYLWVTLTDKVPEVEGKTVAVHVFLFDVDDPNTQAVPWTRRPRWPTTTTSAMTEAPVTSTRTSGLASGRCAING